MFLSPLQVHLCSFEVYLLTRSPISNHWSIFYHSNLWGFSPEIHINGITWYSVFCIWLLSSIIMLLKCFFVVLCISTSFSSTAEWHFIVQKYHELFIDSVIDGNLNCFKLWAIISKSTRTNHIYMFVWIYMFISLVLIHWSEITKLFFQSDCIILHVHKQQQYVAI